MPFEYRYPRPAVTADCAVFSVSDGELEVLLVERGEPPFEGAWATPGGFVEIDEPIGEAAARELEEETGLVDVNLEPFGVFGAPGRDPRGRIISVAHWALTSRHFHAAAAAGSDAAELEWVSISNLPKLGFDHEELLADALLALRGRARTGGIGRGVLDEPFSLADARRLYESVLDRKIAPEQFRKVLVEEVGIVCAIDSGADPEPSDEAFAFDDEIYERLAREPISMFGPNRSRAPTETG